MIFLLLYRILYIHFIQTCINRSIVLAEYYKFILVKETIKKIFIFYWNIWSTSIIKEFPIKIDALCFHNSELFIFQILQKYSNLTQGWWFSVFHKNYYLIAIKLHKIPGLYLIHIIYRNALHIMSKNLLFTITNLYFITKIIYVITQQNSNIFSKIRILYQIYIVFLKSSPREFLIIFFFKEFL